MGSCTGRGRPYPRRWVGAVSVVAIVLVAAAVAGGCGEGDGSASPDEGASATSETVTGTSETMTEQVTGETGRTGEAASTTGHDLYVQAGCGGCHGENAEGTGVGPALAGHSEPVVIRQVRSPLDRMPSYSPARLSDEDLDEIAKYIASLAPQKTHVEPVKLPELSATHHWMALSALQAGDLRDALHHVNHTIDLVQGRHLAAMRRAREHLEAGDAHEAEHLIAEMLAGETKPDLSLRRIHLRLALAAVESRDTKEAIHQVRHFVAVAGGKEKRAGRAVLADLKARDLHEVAHALERLLGETPHDD